MKNFFILFFILFSSIISAQEIEWQNTIGGNASDGAYSIEQTMDGGYIVSGNSQSGISGDKTEINEGNFDYWILKLDGAGNLVWQNTIGGGGTDYIYSIVQTADSGYICIGASNSNVSGDKTEASHGGNDFWVVKLDSFGNIVWQNTIGGTGNDEGRSIMQTVDGGYICGGYSQSGISGDKTEINIGGGDYWILKLDAAGAIQWQNTIGGNNEDKLFSVKQTSDAGYICAGSSKSGVSVDKTEICQGLNDYWVVRLDINGSIQWQNTIGGSSYDDMKSIQQTSDFGFICGGTSQSPISGDKTEIQQGWVDYWILKLDSTGNLQWQNTIGGSLLNYMYDVKQTDDGSYICAGSSQSDLSGDITEDSHNSDFWVIKLDANGDILWQNVIGGTGTEELFSVSTTSDGSFVFAGSSDSDISLDKTENSQGNFDCYVIKLNNSFNLIQGQEFADLNSNNLKDSSEPGIAYKKVAENNTGRFDITDSNGFYSIVVIDSGNYQVAPYAISNYYTAVPVNHNVNFNTYFQIDSLNDFALQPTGNFNDLCVNITPTGAFRSGFNASYEINYHNLGTTTINGTVVFYPDTNVTFVSALPTPSSVTTDSIVFSLGNLTSFQSGQIIVSVNVNQGLPLGTLINSGTLILPVAGDINPGCNQAYWEVFTTGSFDPNDILVNRNFLYDIEIPGEPELEYLIRFQNTGNDTAFFVNVLNPIDTNVVQLNSFEIVSTSHPMNTTWIPWEKNMQFQFDNILLPDSNINEPQSHGFIRYKIKPKTNLIAGDFILNQVHIYFDFNNPVATNIAVTDVILYTGLPAITHNLAPSVFPNPAHDKISVMLKESTQKIESVLVYNVYGQQVKAMAISPSYSTEISIEDLSSGIYFLKLNNDNAFISKFVKY